MLAEYVTLPEAGVVPLAVSLSFEEAATLPCSGVTAWNAVMEGSKQVLPGRTVLIMGTGGVSLMALQLAKAAGARVVATSSSDGKLERVRALGADLTVNYRTCPEWGAEVAKLTRGGVDKVIEVGGSGTLNQSMLAVAASGEIALVGVLDFVGGCNPLPLMFKSAVLRGVAVGSVAMARALNAAIDNCAIKPVIDRVFPFERAPEAWSYQASPDLFGKVVITI
jgi:NADPH:quinone reductase-like Zn-dependent oxidoreductase